MRHAASGDWGAPEALEPMPPAARLPKPALLHLPELLFGGQPLRALVVALTSQREGALLVLADQRRKRV